MSLFSEQSPLGPSPRRAAGWFQDFFWLSAGLSVFYGFVLLLHGPLIIPDEGRYAEIAREMLASHHWVVPTMDNAVYMEKPPLLYWMSAFVFYIFGQHLWTARLVTLCFSVLGCLMTYAAGRHFYNRRTGLIAAGLLATAPAYYICGHYNNLDMGVSILIAASVLLFLVGYYNPSSSRRFILWAAYVVAGLSVLAKGLIGIVFPMMFIGTWILVRRDWGMLKRMQLWSGLLLFLVVAAPWHVLVERQVPGAMHYYFIDQHFKRYIDFNHGHHMSLGLYVLSVIGICFPWVLFFPRMVMDWVGGGWRWLAQEPASVFFIIWAVEVILFFSPSSSILLGYLLPIQIPLVLLLARSLDQRWNESSRALSIASIVSAIIFLGLGIFVLCAPAIKGVLTGLPPAVTAWVTWLSVPLFIVMLAQFILSAQKVKTIVFGFMSSMALLLISLYVSFPHAYQNTSLPFVPVLQSELQKNPNAVVAVYGEYLPDLPFYLNRSVVEANWTGDEFTYSNRLPMADRGDIWTAEQFWAAWHSTQSVFVLMDVNDFKAMSASFGPVRLLKKFYNNVLFTQGTSP